MSAHNKRPKAALATALEAIRTVGGTVIEVTPADHIFKISFTIGKSQHLLICSGNANVHLKQHIRQLRRTLNQGSPHARTQA